VETPRDDDIEFDFFEDEPATEEQSSTQRARRALGGGGRGPRRQVRPPQGVTPLLRLLGLVVFVIALVLILVLLVQSCAASSKHDAYASYMDDVSKIASQSQTDGVQVADALTTSGLKVDKLEEKLRGIAGSERQLVQAATDLNPPGRLRDENQHLVEALQLRVSGVEGLADTFQSTAASKSAQDAALLAEQADRLLASDVVWDDLFYENARRQLQRDGVTGVRVPDSNFVANRDLVGEESMTQVLRRIRGASVGGTPTGLHGTNIVSVKAVPGGQTLNTTENTVTATTDLAFAVTIADSGDSQEVQIKVTLTIEKPDNPIVKTQTIDLINSGEEKTVTFTDLGQVPFATKTNLKVDVQPVPGEKNTSNNSATYPVIFSLG
jgi:hypothetical protein